MCRAPPVRGDEEEGMAIKSYTVRREPVSDKNSESESRERFLALRTSFYQELARLLQMRTDMSLPELISVLEYTEKYPRCILQSMAKKLREGEASFSVAIRNKDRHKDHEHPPGRMPDHFYISDLRAQGKPSRPVLKKAFEGGETKCHHVIGT